ncbi:hypothetical protein QTG54_009710 [Skeletonema marinoi]|uniref:HSF-type DNA-binding domain-containing protein n=1 Tax=Skeletonema marinoi TaxID=267567 RepID=A0AAD8Y759_9STRA|nr:hypothetical protein QTG54_009710 [Skeletonema marinoi]
MLDRESQNSTIVHWSTDGNSFIIIMDEDIIPTYFDNPIIFASFQSKLYLWGFNRVSNRETGRHEFCSPAFRRLSVDNAVAAAEPSSNAGVQVQQQQQQTLASSLLQALAQSIKPGRCHR